MLVYIGLHVHKQIKAILVYGQLMYEQTDPDISILDIKLNQNQESGQVRTPYSVKKINMWFRKS